MNNVGEWEKIALPSIGASISPDADEELCHSSLRWNGKPVHVTNLLSIDKGLSRSTFSDWFTGYAMPDRLVTHGWDNGGELYVLPLWTQAPNTSRRPNSCRFPPKWNRVGTLSLRFRWTGSGIMLMNPDHPFSQVDLSDFEEPQSREHFVAKFPNPREKRALYLTDRGLAMKWLLSIGLIIDMKTWGALVERDRAFLDAVWEFVFPDVPPGQPIYFLAAHRDEFFEDDRCRIIELSPSGIERYFGADEARCVLPDPGDEWKLVIDNSLPD